jgi:U3 small nucleolar RNA-associated protein 14
MYGGDDEEISEGEAFDAEHEKKWGPVLNPILKRSRGPAKAAPAASAVHAGLEESESSEGEDTVGDSDEDESGDDQAEPEASSAGDDVEDAEDDKDEGDLTLAELLDANLERERKRGASLSDGEAEGIVSSDAEAEAEGTSMSAAQHRQLLSIMARMPGARQGVPVPDSEASHAPGASQRLRLLEQTVAFGGGPVAAGSEFQMGGAVAGTGVGSKRRRPADLENASAGGGLTLELLMRRLTRGGAEAPDAIADDVEEASAGDAQRGQQQKLGQLQRRLEQLTGAGVTAAATGASKRRGRASEHSAAGLLGGVGPLQPLPSATAVAKAGRGEAYVAASRHVSRWNELVQINRRAPHLSFSAEAAQHSGFGPGGAAGAAAGSASALAARFTPASEFEAAVAEALTASGLAALPATSTAGAGSGQGDAAVLAGERGELRRLMREAEEAAAENGPDGRQGRKTRKLVAVGGLAATAAAAGAGDPGSDGEQDEEDGEGGVGGVAADDPLPVAALDPRTFRQRSAALARMRSLLFNEERKRARQNRIKSKTYRALKGRQDMRRGQAERAELAAVDPDAAAALEAEEARLLARERMSLKHRAGKGIGGSKWVHRVLSRPGGGGGRDAATRDQLVAHLQRAQELQDRMRTAKEQRDGADSDSDGPGDDGAEGEDDDDGELAALLAAGASDEQVLAAARRRVLAEAGALETGGGGSASDGEVEGADAFSGTRARMAAFLASAAADGALPASTSTSSAAGAGGKGGPAQRGLMGMRFMQDALARGEQAAKESALQVAGQLDAAAHAAGGGKAPRTRGAPSANGAAAEDDWSDAMLLDEAEADDDAFGAEALRLRPEGAEEEEQDGGWAAAAAASGGPSGDPASKAGGSGRLAFAGTATTHRASTKAGRGASKAAAASGAVAGALEGIAAAAGCSYSNRARDAPGSGGDSRTTVTMASAADVPTPATAAASAANPWLADVAFSSDAGARGAVSRHTATRRAVQSAAAAVADAVVAPVDISGALQRLSAAAAPASATAATSRVSEQRELIRRAFVSAVGDEEAVEGLAAEKHADEEEAEAAQTSGNGGPSKRGGNAAGASAAGWGHWVGQGAASAEEQAAAALAARASAAKRRRPNAAAFPQMAGAAPSGPRPVGTAGGSSLAAGIRGSGTALSAAGRVPGSGSKAKAGMRADSRLSTVLISERRDRKLAAFQVGTVPHPFTSREQYERFLRQPVGPEWNTLAASAAMTVPELLSRAGLIIEPIRYAEVRKQQAGQREAASAAATAGKGLGRRKER